MNKNETDLAVNIMFQQSRFKLKNVLLITNKNNCNHCQPLSQLLSKNGYKVVISEYDKEEIKNKIWDNFIEIIILLPTTDIKTRCETCKWLYKNYPNKIYFVYLPEANVEKYNITNCNLYIKSRCRASFLFFNCITQPELFISRFKILIDKNCKEATDSISSQMFAYLHILITQTLQLPLLKPAISSFSLSPVEAEEKIDILLKFISKELVKFISKKFLVDKISLFFYDTNTEDYILYGSKNYEIKKEPVVLSKSWLLIKEVLKEKKMFLIQDGIIHYPKVKKITTRLQPNIVSSIIIPLMIGNEVLGIINLARKEKANERFTKFDLYLLEKMSSWIVYIFATILSIKISIEYSKLKDDFVSIVNHELRTPLMALSAAIELIEGKIPPNIETIIRRNISRLSSMIEEILDFSRISRRMFKIVKRKESISQLVNEIVEEYKIQLDKKNIRFELEYNVKTDTAVFDKQRIKQIITNFINNSIKFFPEEKQDKYIKLLVEEEKDNYHFCVEDNGKGIKKSDLKKIFLPFIQIGDIMTDHKPGLGLGLYISYEIMKQHEGKIWIESEEGKYTKAHILLPKNLSGGRISL